jgi:hypothetical protein
MSLHLRAGLTPETASHINWGLRVMLNYPLDMIVKRAGILIL